MFRRTTDDHIYSRHGKRSLDVGANLIARTAHSALGLLETLRELTETSIPLAWSPDTLYETSAIEVYPAATRSAYGIAPKGDCEPVLKKIMDFAEGVSLPDQSEHVWGAILCVAAGLDFLSGIAEGPMDIKSAKQEGWIWCAPPKSNA